MIRKPRSLFRARVRPSAATPRGKTLYVGPEFVGPEPNYMPLLDEFARTQGHLLKPGTAHMILVYHDDDCQVFEGGACDCEPELRILTKGA